MERELTESGHELSEGGCGVSESWAWRNVSGWCPGRAGPSETQSDGQMCYWHAVGTSRTSAGDIYDERGKGLHWQALPLPAV